MARERSMKHSILRSFETLIKGMDPSAEEPEPQQPQQPQEPQPKPVKPGTIAETGVFLGRKWQLYSDGTCEGETVLGMEAFRDLDHFKAFVEASPVLRNERSIRQEPAPAPRPAGEAGISEAVPAADSPAAIAHVDVVQSPPREKGQAAHPAAVKPIRSSPDLQLARDLAMAGGLGILLCVFWWFRSYVFDDLHAELLRRGLSENVIRPTNLSKLHSLPCFFLNTEPCVAMKHWGRFAGRLVYEPAFAWASMCALGLGFLLIHIWNRRPKIGLSGK